MPRYYCDYCDTYLTHDSPSVRKQHNAGYKHKANVRTYYQQFEEQQTQSLIDQRIKEHLGQAAALQQVGAAYAAMQRARPVLQMPGMMPMPGFPQGAPLAPGIRPPSFPRPMGGPQVYGAPPPMMPPPQMMQPPSSGPQSIPFASMPTNGLPAPPMNVPSPAPGATTTPSPNLAPTPGAQSMYPAGPNFGNPPNIAAPPSFPSSTAAPNNNQ